MKGWGGGGGIRAANQLSERGSKSKEAELSYLSIDPWF